MKSYTDINQSKKLAEILPLESADMLYYCNKSNNIPISQYPFIRSFKEKDTFSYLHCWSLAALLDVLPFHLIVNNQRYAFSMHKGLNKDGETYMLRYNVFNTDVCLYSTDYYNNPIDAYYELILKLHELKML